MTNDGDISGPPGLFDQDAHSEGGYLRDAQVRLPRRGSAGRRAAGRPSVPLGATRVTSRARYTSTARPQRSTRGIVAPLLILLVSLGGLAYVGYHQYLSSEEGSQGAAAQAGEVVDAGTSTTALLVQTDGAGDSVGFTMISLHESGDAVVLFAPSTLMVEVPGIGLDTLSEATRIGGIELSSLAVENLLTIGFDHIVELTPADVTELVRSFDPLLVDNPRRLDQATDRDRIEVLYPAGALLLEASDASDYLARRGVAETELQRLVRHQEFWVSLLEARSAVVADERSFGTDFDDFLDELAARRTEVEYRILDVDLVGGEGELYSVDRASLEDSIVRLDPSRATGSARTRVQLLNGVGRPGLSAPIARLINPVFASVELVDNAARFDHRVTQVVYYHDEQREAAVAIRDALGVGEVVKQLEPIDVVDITIVVGSDLADLVEIQPDVAPVVDQAGTNAISGP